jgi:hypothetical protein
MTAWTTLSDATLTSGKPGTQAVFRALRDNAIAISEGSSGAPKNQMASIQPGSVGQIVKTAAGPAAAWGWPDAYLIASGSAAGSSSIDIALDGDTSNYPANFRLLVSYAPSTSGEYLKLRLSGDGGSSFPAGSGDYGYLINHGSYTTGDHVPLGRNSNFVGSAPSNFSLDLINIREGRRFALAWLGYGGTDSEMFNEVYHGFGGYRAAAITVTDVRLLVTTGTFGLLKYWLLGLRG